MAGAESPKSKLEKLARLKSLKSGLKQSRAASDDIDLASLVADEKSKSGVEPPAQADAPVFKPSVVQPKEAVQSENLIDDDPESLSAYFEALGIVPDAPKEGVSSVTADMPAAEAEVKLEGPGRDVDERDLWADPVRDDPSFVTSFETVNADKSPEPKAEESAEVDEDLSLDAIIGSFDDDDASDDELPEENDEPSATDDDAAAEFNPLEDPVDIEAFEAELSRHANVDAESDIPLPDNHDFTLVEEGKGGEKATISPEQPLTITFDESRSTLLAHVSKQMNCSIDDVVVTALDWYLDALFGEEDPNVEASVGD